MAKRQTTTHCVIHCAATPPSLDEGAAWINDLHVNKFGWRAIGYHQVIRRNGVVEMGRPMEDMGAHTKGMNSVSIGICLMGGVDENGNLECNFTQEQKDALRTEVDLIKAQYPGIIITGHRDVASEDLDGDGVLERNEWVKGCPSFDVAHWLETDEMVLDAAA